MNFAIYIYDDVEVLDFCGPFEVFSTASRLLDNSSNIFLVGGCRSIKTRGGIEVVPRYTLENHPKIDVLIIPGGIHFALMGNQSVLKWIKSIHESTILTASVCTGVFILAQAGIIKNDYVTTHWEDLELLRSQFPLLKVKSGVRFTDQGKILTSAGISAGIDMSLHIVSRLYGLDHAKKTALQLEYSWVPYFYDSVPTE